MYFMIRTLIIGIIMMAVPAFAAETPKDIAQEGFKTIFVDFDAEAAKKRFAPDYIQHNVAVPTGAQPVLDFIPVLKKINIKPTVHRVIAEGDMVVMHTTYENAQALGGDTMVAFDVFRIENGKIAEHWDNLQAAVDLSKTASGNTMTDGATKITDHHKTAENKALVKAFVRDVLQGAAPDKITDYISTETYIQHNPGIGNGLDGLGKALAAMAEAGQAMAYNKTHIIVAEGNFVFTASEGTLGDTPTAFFDLFRIEDGKIVEHWDTVSPIPPASEMAHRNGKFEPAPASVIEIVTMKLKDGVTFEAFAPVDHAVETEHVSKQPGFIARETARGEDGEWLVAVHWASAEDAQASMDGFSSAPAAARFMQMIDTSTMQMKRYTLDAPSQ